MTELKFQKLYLDHARGQHRIVLQVTTPKGTIREVELNLKELALLTRNAAGILQTSLEEQELI